MLLCVTPVLAGYMYFSIGHSSRIYAEDLKRETRATSRALQAALEGDIAEGDWKAVRNAFERIRHEGVEAALLDSSGKITFSLADFPLNPPPPIPALNEVLGGKPTEFMGFSRNLYWFCRVAPLGENNGRSSGVLLVAQEWSDLHEALRRRVVTSVLAGAVAVTLIAILIPLVSRRYVSQPLAELSRRISEFSTEAEARSDAGGDEFKLLTEEFQRLDQQLATAQLRLRDESERKIELERRLRHSDKLATIGTLASGLAHEIGTPLGVIRGRAEHLLRSNPDPRKLNQGLEIIINQIDRITRIVRMLLDFGRRREPIRSTTDVRPIVQRTLHLLETEAERRNIRLVSDLGTTPLLADCDADQLQQVFVNLGMNALDAMAENGGTLRVSAERRPAEAGEQVRLYFEDDGPGVEEQMRERVFDPFFTTKDPGKGTGMGLAVSQSIVRDHDGEITLEPGIRG